MFEHIFFMSYVHVTCSKIVSYECLYTDRCDYFCTQIESEALMYIIYLHKFLIVDILAWVNIILRTRTRSLLLTPIQTVI